MSTGRRRDTELTRARTGGNAERHAASWTFYPNVCDGGVTVAGTALFAPSAFQTKTFRTPSSTAAAPRARACAVNASAAFTCARACDPIALGGAALAPAERTASAGGRENRISWSPSRQPASFSCCRCSHCPRRPHSIRRRPASATRSREHPCRRRHDGGGRNAAGAIADTARAVRQDRGDAASADRRRGHRQPVGFPQRGRAQPRADTTAAS